MILQPIDITEINKRLGGHTIFSPSGSAMWSTCSGSLLPNLYAKDSAGIDAAYGTVAHGVGETWLRSGEKPKHLIGTVEKVVEPSETFEIEIDNAMLDYVEQYVDWCMYLPGSHFVETRVSISDLTPIENQGGTADHAVCTPSLLIITDLKMGKGVQVYAFENTQALLYAYGFFQEWDWLYDFKSIVIRIAQPRLNHFDEWTITREELLKWAGWLKERAHAAWCTDASRTPSAKGCQWCKVKSDCSAHAVFAEKLLDGVFDNLDEAITDAEMTDIAKKLDDNVTIINPQPIGKLTLAQMAKLLPYRKMIESWFAELHAETERRCLDGEKIPGYKIVAGKTNREFINEHEAVQHLEFLGIEKSNLFKSKMVGLTDIEEQLRKAGFASKTLPSLLKPIVRKPVGKPTMALVSDKRTELTSTIDEVFGNEDDL